MTAPALSNAVSLGFFGPELVLSVGTLGVLVVGLVRRATSRGAALALAIATLLASAAATILTGAPAWGGGAGTGEARVLFAGLMARDGFADFFKLLFAAAGVVVALGSLPSREARGDEDPEVASARIETAPSTRR